VTEGFVPAGALETALDDPMVGRTLGHNTILAKLAAGGMAEIFLATQRGALGVARLVVVKRILPSLAENDEFRSMFHDEARIAAQLEHPNIIRVEDFGEDPQDHSLYMVMEYVEGVPVIDRLKVAAKAKQPVDVRWAATVITQAAEGLHFAHELERADGSGVNLGLVHRDISPHNILVTPNGIVKVFDFGIAKAMDRMTQTAAGVVKGKFAYMSPEQARGGAIDRRSDVFSLAIVLWEMLTLKRLFARGNDLDTYRALLETKVPRASELRADVFPELDNVIAYALAREPEGRFATARAFGQAVNHAIGRHGGVISNAQVGEPIRQHFGDQLAARKRLAARKLTMPPAQALKQTSNSLRRIDEIQVPGMGAPPARTPTSSGPEAVVGPGGLVAPFTPGPVSKEQVVQVLQVPPGGGAPVMPSGLMGFSGQMPVQSAGSDPFGAVPTAMVRPPMDKRESAVIPGDEHAEADAPTRANRKAARPAGGSQLTRAQKIAAVVIFALLAAGVVAGIIVGN